MPRRLPLTAGLFAAIVIGCLLPQEAVTNSATADELGKIVVSRRTLTAQGGRVDWKNPPDTARTLRLELWARQMSTGNIFRPTDFNKQLADRGRVLTSDYAWGPLGREIAVYYATFSRGLVTQKIDILSLDRTY